MDSFSTVKDNFLTALKNDASTENDLQHLFLELRLCYKKTEWATEYFTPFNARLINGAPVAEIEANGTTNEPAGLQVIEPLLFPKYKPAEKTAIIQLVGELQIQYNKIKVYFENFELFDWQIFDAAKLEVFRIETLGIAGFDNSLTLRSMQESAACLQGVNAALKYYANNDGKEQLPEKINRAIHYLQSNSDFNSFNRADFIIHYANPITISIAQLEKRLKIPEIVYSRLLKQDAQTLFDTDAFNSKAYTLNSSNILSSQKIALGKMLFADPVFSGNGKRSCQSCHQPVKAFTDGLTSNTEISSNKHLLRNTPTLLNAALQPAQFYDLRVHTVEEQIIDVVNNKNEMEGSLKLVVEKLWHNNKYKKLFAEAFPKQNRTGIDSSEILIALASYIRSLVGLNGPFDDYMRGDENAMNPNQVNGFNLFMGKARCGTCHFLPLFNGTFPPKYIKIESEVIGVPQSKDLKTLDSDEGQYNITKVASLSHSFKTPTLRNAALTAPYMHNGVFSTLEEVINFYNKGGGAGLGLNVYNQTLPFNQLDLTQKEQSDLIAFIKGLNSKRIY